MMSAPPPAKPRFMTPRSQLPTLGGKVDQVGRMIGGGLRDWQRQAVDVALEIGPDGKWKYDRVLISVPRQSGKTNLFAKVAVHRALAFPGTMAWMSAQTGAAARERFIKEIAQPCEKNLRPLVSLKFGAGDTRLLMPVLGSQIRPMPPTAAYLHGEQSDLVGADEAWAFTPASGQAYIQAVEPTQFSRPNPQIFWLSTAGDGGSDFWHDMLDSGRDIPGTCVIDFGVPPGEDPTDLDTVIRYHPLNQWVEVREKIAKQHVKLDPLQFARAYGNVRSKTRESILPPAVVAAAVTDAPLDAGPVALGIAVSVDQSEAAIAAVGTIDGTAAAEIIAARPGTSWVPAVIRKIVAEHQIISVSIDAHGPALTLAERLKTEPIYGLTSGDAGARIVSTEDLVAGTELFMTRIEAAPPQLLLRRNEALVDEIGGAALRTLGDRGRALSRSRSLTPVHRLEATILGLRDHTKVREMPGKPVVWSPS